MSPEEFATNIQEYSQALITGLEPLANKLQVPFESVWTWGIKYNYALATAEIFVLLVGIALMFWGYKIDEGDDSYGDPSLLSMTLAVAGGATAIIGLFTAGDAILRFIAPEWHTIELLLDMVRNST